MGWDILAIPAAAIGRSLLGWLTTSIEDGKITNLEWKKLGTTIIRICLINIGILGLAGVSEANVDMVSVAMSSVLVDQLIRLGEKAVKKK